MQVIILDHLEFGTLGVFSTRGGNAAQKARVWAFLRETYSRHPAMRKARPSQLDAVLRKLELEVHTVDVIV